MNAQPSDFAAGTRDDPDFDRELFYRLLDPEGFLDYHQCARDRILRECSGAKAPNLDFSGLFAEPSKLDRKDFRLPEFSEPLNQADCRDLILQLAPSALLGRCWLRRFSQAGNSHTELASSLFRVYRAGLNREAQEITVHAFADMLRHYAIDLPPVGSFAFCHYPELSNSAFRYALIRLCLARCAQEFIPELIGFTAAEVFGLSGILDQALIAQFKTLGIPDRYLSATSECGIGARSALEDALSQFLKTSPDIEQARTRIECGLRIYLENERNFWIEIEKSRADSPSPSARVLALFRHKAPFGRGLHGKLSIGGRELDEWLDQGLEDGDGFLKALTASEWFDVCDPDQSLFLNRVNAPNGRMDGVFSRQELDCIRAWLRSQKHETALDLRSGPLENRAALGLRPAPAPSQRLARESARGGVREMYFQLVNAPQYPDILPAAKSYVQRCLRLSRWASALSRNSLLRSFDFDHAEFEHRIFHLYRRQVDRYRPAPYKVLKRAHWIWIIRQFAPTVLVDGCWLQSIFDPGMEGGPVARGLWKIYADEIGNGQAELNHPAIYRKLLDSLNIDLPAIHTREFAQHSSLVSGAFDIPVYLLSLAQFPRSFLPELIGVNLAIELSGLGGGYLRLAESLDYWGIDASIVRVHQSADNLAYGHSAIACNVVALYLDSIVTAGGTQLMRKHWARIWNAFISIRILPMRFIAQLAWRNLLGLTKV